MPGRPGLVRFVPRSATSQILIGEPVNASEDVGAAIRAGKEVLVKLFSGTSVLSPGSSTDEVAVVERLLSPLAQEEVGTIRCIGLNVWAHSYIHQCHDLKLIGRSTCSTQKRSKWTYLLSPRYSCMTASPSSSPFPYLLQ